MAMTDEEFATIVNVGESKEIVLLVQIWIRVEDRAQTIGRYGFHSFVSLLTLCRGGHKLI